MFDIGKYLGSITRIFTRKDLALLFLLVACYFATRFINLDQFPIFSDEGIYIRWAKIAWHDATWRFISLTDGKQPLQTWGTIPFLKLFPDNALLAGRLFAVSTGFVALTGVVSFLTYLWGGKTGIAGGFFYVFTPYFLFYDRMALVDSGVNAGFIWILFFSILLARHLRLDIALIMGLIGGLSLLSKSSVRIFIGLASLAPILFMDKRTQQLRQRILNFIILYGIVVILALVIYNIQRLSPFFHYVAEKNKTFIVTPDEFLRQPFALFLGNVQLIPLYVFWELGFILGLLGVLGLVKLYFSDRKLALYLLVWLLISYFIVATVSKVLFPRYLIFFASLLLITGSYFITHWENKKMVTVFILTYILSVGYFNYTILFQPQHIPFPPVDRGQYVEGWPAGWGVKDMIDYSREKSKEKPVIILAEGNFGLAGDVLDTHLKPDDNISIRGYWPLDEKDLRAHQKDLTTSYVYVVLSHQTDIPPNWPVRLIKKYDKPGNQSRMFLLELTQ